MKPIILHYFLVANASWSTFDQNNSSFISNPFVNEREDIWPSSANVLNNNHTSSNNNFQNMDVFSFNPANPFRQTQISKFDNGNF